MNEAMGTFRIDIEISTHARPEDRRRIGNVLVDTGAELSVLPATLLDELGVPRLKQVTFRQADGSSFARWTGSVLTYVAGTLTADEVVFGEPGDIVLLGARSLEGLNLRIEPVAKRLVDAGPMTAGALAA
jgi:predicted aspartyl protease